MRDPDPRMDDATRRRLARLVDAIEVGPAPTRDELTRRTGAREGDELRPYVISSNGSTNGKHDPHDRDGWDGRHRIVPTRQARRPTPAVLIGLAAVIALVLGGLAVRQSGSGSDGRDGRDTVQTDVADDPEGRAPTPRLVIDPAADSDLQPLSTLSARPRSERDPGLGNVSLYGTEGADEPFAPGDLAVVVTNGDEVLQLQGEAVTVRGRDGRTATSHDQFASYLDVSDESPVTWLQWSEDAVVTVTLLSRSLSAETLAEVAEGLTVEGADARLGAVPDGVGTTEIGRLGHARFDSILYASGDDTGYRITYGASGVGDSVYTGDVTVVSGGPSELTMIRWLAAVADPVDVRGTDGWTSHRPSLPTADVETLLWEESDGVIVIVTLARRPVGETLTVAHDLVPASYEQWDVIPTEAEFTNGG